MECLEVFRRSESPHLRAGNQEIPVKQAFHTFKGIKEGGTLLKVLRIINLCAITLPVNTELQTMRNKTPKIIMVFFFF
jgi:hypothetical protein